MSSTETQDGGDSGESNPGPLAPKARIIPLDHYPEGDDLRIEDLAFDMDLGGPRVHAGGPRVHTGGPRVHDGCRSGKGIRARHEDEIQYLECRIQKRTVLFDES